MIKSITNNKKISKNGNGNNFHARSQKTFEKIKKKIDIEKLEISLKTPDDLNRLILNVNSFMLKRLELKENEEIIGWWLKSMKRYLVLISIMNGYCQNEFSTYKEIIIKELRVFSYKTISNIIDEAIDKKYLKYIKNNSVNDKKIKRLIPSSRLVSAFLNWNLRNIKNYNEQMKVLKKDI